MLSSSITDPRALARELAGRQAFVLFALVFCVAAVVNAWVHAGGPWVQRLPAVAYAAAAIACVLATRMPDHLAGRALTAVSVLGVMLVGATAVIYGWGLNGPGIGFFAIVTLVFAAFFSLRSGVAMALLCITVLGALGWAEHQGWIIGPAALGDTLVLRRWITLSLLVASGLGTWLKQDLLSFGMQYGAANLLRQDVRSDLEDGRTWRPSRPRLENLGYDVGANG